MLIYRSGYTGCCRESFVHNTYIYHKPSSLPINERLCLEYGSVENKIHLLCHCKQNATLNPQMLQNTVNYIVISDGEVKYHGSCHRSQHFCTRYNMAPLAIL